MNGIVSLRNASGTANISTHGAELRSWTVEGREMIWPGDAASWPKSAPILFPVVGRSAGGQVAIAGDIYPMPIHGFANAADFAIDSLSASEATLTLQATEATRRHYPFAFRLSVTYALEPDALTARLRVTNEDTRPMPYAAGLHPGFGWASRALGGGAIRFGEGETPLVPVITPEGLFSSDRRAIAMDGRTMALTPPNLGNEAVCFLDANSQALTFLPGDGTALDVSHEGFAHFAFWTKTGAAFLCIESWTGHGDAPDGGGELAERPSTIVLAAGETREHRARYAFRETR